MSIDIYIGHYSNNYDRFMKHETELKEKWPDITIENTCLCALPEDYQSKEVVIFHPNHHNEDGCWSRIYALAQKNPETEFFLLSACTMIHERYFSELMNINPMDFRLGDKLLRHPVHVLEVFTTKYCGDE